MGRILFDIRCDNCGHTEVDHYDEGGLGEYGACIMCAQFNDDGVLGTMRQVLSTGGFRMGTTANISGMTGRTTNGTKWEVAGRPRKYDYRSKKFGSEVL